MEPVTLAYIDPGSGSLIIQVLVAAIVAIPIFFRRQIARIASRLGRSAHQRPEDPRSDAP